MYTIEFSHEAMEDLKWFRKTDQNIIVDGIEDSLRHQATVETRNREQLRPNQTQNGSFGSVTFGSIMTQTKPTVLCPLWPLD